MDGLLFNRYRIEREIGRGGMGVVYLATDERLDEQVALKRIHTSGGSAAQAEETRKRALREARSGARIRRHPHVVAIHNVEEDESGIWLVLEYVPSRSLQEHLDESGPLSARDAARIGAAIADALAAAHDAGIQHRDVTPGNILIGDDGVPRLTDFGISHLAGYPTVTASGLIGGTFAYLAPEIANGEEATAKADVFSLGATLYAAVEGRPPFGDAGNPFQLLRRVGAGVADPPRRAGVLEPALRRMLMPDPTRRPAPDAVGSELTTIADAAPDGASAPVPPWQRDLGPAAPPAPAETAASPHRRGRWRAVPRRLANRRGPLVTAGAAVLAAALAVGVTLWLTHPDDRTGDAADQPASATSTPRGLPPLPTTVRSFEFGSEKPDIDLCRLLDQKWLRQYGTVDVQRGDFLESCYAAMRHGKSFVDVNLSMYPPSNADTIVTKDSKTRTSVGSMTIYEDVKDRQYGARCQDVVRLDDDSYVDVYTSRPAPDPEPCEVVHTAARLVARGLSQGHVPRDPKLLDRYTLARSKACDALDTFVLSRIPGLPETKAADTWTHWSCTWGNDAQNSDDAYVTLTFERAARAPSTYAKQETTVDGKKFYYAADGRNQCTGYLAFSDDPDGADHPQTLYLQIWEPTPGRACDDLRTLAADANQRLS